MIRDVLVQLDGGADDELRLLHAEAIATAAQAHVTGLFTNSLPDIAALMPVDGGAATAQVLADLDEKARRSGDRIQQHLTGRLSRLSVSNELLRLDGPPGQLAGRAASEARRADLFVASRPYGRDDASRWDELFEAVLFGSGRGVYVVPPGRKPSDAIRRILVAWRDTRETARAVAEAAPLIGMAARTNVLVVDPETEAAVDLPAPGIDLARHLERYGTNVEVSLLDSGGRPVGEIILDQARRTSADVIVMGAYGHSRAREWFLGGATRDILETSEFPILMAH
jgi:nucleotide-binding universal stress UspA family protein